MQFMGIDGGGTSLKIVIVDEDMHILAEKKGPAVNPNTVGYDEARAIIQDAIRDISADIDIDAVGIGVAGAPNNIADGWLRNTVTPILPDSTVICSSDQEIALVGAHGQRYGILVLAGTGSLAYGVNRAGESVIVGAWGPMVGDEGSAYWIGTTALNAIFMAADGRGQPTALADMVYHQLNLEDEWELLKWRYREAHTSDVARLAPEVFRVAEEGDHVASQIVDTAANDLALQARTVMKRLNMENPPVAFTGGMLQRDNLLSRTLCQLLGIESLPVAKYPPVIGAALLAKEQLLNG